MDINDVFDKAKSGFDAVCKKTEEAVSLSKLSIEKSAAEAKLEKAYIRLGKVYYEALLANGEVSPHARDNLIAEITQRLQAIEKINGKIEEVKNKKYCPSCGRYSDKRAAYCSFCGERIN